MPEHAHPPQVAAHPAGAEFAVGDHPQRPGQVQRQALMRGEEAAVGVRRDDDDAPGRQVAHGVGVPVGRLQPAMPERHDRQPPAGRGREHQARHAGGGQVADRHPVRPAVGEVLQRRALDAGGRLALGHRLLRVRRCACRAWRALAAAAKSPSYSSRWPAGCRRRGRSGTVRTAGAGDSEATVGGAEGVQRRGRRLRDEPAAADPGPVPVAVHPDRRGVQGAGRDRRGGRQSHPGGARRGRSTPGRRRTGSPRWDSPGTRTPAPRTRR